MLKGMLPRFALVTILLAAGVCAAAQPSSPGVFDLDKDREPMVVLNGTWRFHPGDDARWAELGFDDSHWSLLRGDKDWGSQGFPGLTGYGWYRAKLLIPAGAPVQWLFILSGSIMTDYQVFADGKMLEGCSARSITSLYLRRNVSCPLGNTGEVPAHTVVLAIRVWHWPHWAGYVPGGLQGRLRVGGARPIRWWGAFQSGWTFLYCAKSDVLALLYGLAGISALGLFLLRRREREYLWFGAYSVLYCAQTCFETWTAFNPFGIKAHDLVANLIYVPQDLALIAFYFVLFGGRRNWLFWAALGGVAAILPINLIGGAQWISAALWNEVGPFAVLPMYVWTIYLVVRRAAEGFPDARLLLAPSIMHPLMSTLNFFSIALFVVGWIHQPPDWLVYTFHWPFPFNLQDLADFIFLPAMMTILVLRFNRASTQGERLAAEMEAARAVQQILVPEKIAPVEGYAVESAYRPASQVSGDFFQVLPLRSGGTLLALGDVSGKGLKAAMTGTLAIGAMRTLAAEGLGPAALLTKLNEQIVASQQGGFITMICAMTEPDGSVIVANAGHLNPYRSGEEIAVGSGFPLGVITGTTYSETRVSLNVGDTLTFLSDGVVESRSASGELFGFDRTREISGRTPTLIAEVAQEFGQDDDITVLSLTRVGEALGARWAGFPAIGRLFRLE
jgi:hypothetical protein